MKFHLVTVEPQGYRYGHFLDDGIRLLLYGLESLGHDVSLGINKLRPGRVNVIWGALLNRLDDVCAVASAGPYVALQTEVMSEAGLNAWHNRDTVEQVYLPFLRGAVAIWDVKPRDVQRLQQMGLSAHRIPIGYHPRFEEIPPGREKDIDFCFFGSVTPHRAELMEQLRRRGCEVEVLFDTRKLFRDDVLARTKVHLAPAHSRQLNELSLQRVCYLLNNRGLCVVEEAPDQASLEHCFETAPTDQWADVCLETLARPDRQQLAESYYERYREIRLEDGFEELLDQSLGGRVAGGRARRAARGDDEKGGITASGQPPLVSSSIQGRESLAVPPRHSSFDTSSPSSRRTRFIQRPHRK